MYLIAGLGNPGLEYENTRHNLGFMAADEIARMQGLSFSKKMFCSLYTQASIGGEKFLLVKPLTYMNKSGISVAGFANYFKIEHENIIVIHDDVDFELGAIKIRERGSGGTHNGMKDIVSALGGSNFPRVRIGAGNNKLYDLADYVLSAFTDPEEKKTVATAIHTAAEAALAIITQGVPFAMNRYNTKKERKPAQCGPAADEGTKTD